MISKKIESLLSDVFRLPVVEDITQTKIARCISYAIDPVVSVSTIAESSMTFETMLTVYMRDNRGYDAIGVMSSALSRYVNGRAVDCKIDPIDKKEKIEAMGEGVVIVSKDVRIVIKTQYDEEKEPIKKVDIQEAE